MRLPPFDPWLSSAAAGDVLSLAHAGARALAQRQSRRLHRLLDCAARHSRFYRREFGGRDPAGLRLADLPPVRKQTLMAHFDEWVTDPELRLDELREFVADRSRIAEPFLGRYVVWESSGSTGEPGIFVQDAATMAVLDALEALRRPVVRPARNWFDPWAVCERMVFVGAIGGHFASTVSVERLRRLNPMVAYNTRSVSFLQPLDRLVAELDALAPTVIATYPTAATLLAEEHLAGRLRCMPREIWTGGESLSPAMRQFITQAFGCPVVNSYGASEFLSLACECEHGQLHLNSDWVILESVDDHGRPVPDGEFGATTLLTNLANHVQPLIRYDLGDRIALHAQRCSCGSPLPVLEVQGRDDDMLQLGPPGTRAVTVLPLALSTVLEDDAGVFDFQLVQQGPCRLLLRTGLRGDAGAAAMQRAITVLQAFLQQHGARGIEIEYRCNEPGRCGRSGKVQRVVALHA